MIRKIIKDILGIMQFGIAKIYAPPKAIILMYHSIGDNGAFFTVKPEVFEKQIKYLVENKYSIISLDKLVGMIRDRVIISKKTIVLTFDDGFKDNYLYAFPILKKYNILATIFLITDYIGKKMSSENKKLEMLSWPEIKKMQESGLINFGCHTVSHRKLTQLSESEISQELSNSKKIIENNLSEKCKFFAYPKGRFSELAVEEVKKAGFIAAVSVIENSVDLKSDLFILPRRAITSQTSWQQFLGKISAWKLT